MAATSSRLRWAVFAASPMVSALLIGAPELAERLPRTDAAAVGAPGTRPTVTSSVTSARNDIPGSAIATLPSMLDAAVRRLMAEQHAPGTAVVAVHQGRVVFLRGYGTARFDPSTPVDPTRTLFRIGSVTKPLTAAALLQLVDEGRLDLQGDIRRHLPFLDLRATTTPHQLLTHTAGFDEKFAGGFTSQPDQLLPLGTYVERHAIQAFGPGHVYSYSNTNYMVAGLLIERVTGSSYEEAMRRRLFAPLRMNATTASQPPEGALAAQRASGYAWDGSAQRPLLFRYTQSRPGGAVSTTAADMGRFMLMLLGDGSLDGARALSPASRAAMLQPQFRSHPRLPGVTYAFRQWETRGRLLLHHDGTLGDQVAVMLLDPANAFGLFVASNANPGIGNHLLDPLLTHLFGPAPPVPPPAPVRPATGNAQRVAGAYRDYHRTRHDLSRIRALMPMLQSRVAPDGDAITWGGRRWVEVEPMVFQTTGSGDRLVFGPGLMQTWTTSYERIGWTEQSWFHITVVLTCLLVFVGYVAWHARTRRRLAEARAARFCALFVAVANVTFLVWLMASIRTLGETTPLPAVQLAGLALGVAAAGVATLLPAHAWFAWRERWWTRGGRVAYTLVAIAGLAFSTWLSEWKLLGFHY